MEGARWPVCVLEVIMKLPQTDLGKQVKFQCRCVHEENTKNLQLDVS